MAVCTPVIVVPTSSATWAMDTFMTELSRVIRNCPDASVSRTAPDAAARVDVLAGLDMTGAASCSTGDWQRLVGVGGAASPREGWCGATRRGVMIGGRDDQPRRGDHDAGRCTARARTGAGP